MIRRLVWASPYIYPFWAQVRELRTRGITRERKFGHFTFLKTRSQAGSRPEGNKQIRSAAAEFTATVGLIRKRDPVLVFTSDILNSISKSTPSSFPPCFKDFCLQQKRPAEAGLGYWKDECYGLFVVVNAGGDHGISSRAHKDKTTHAYCVSVHGRNLKVGAAHH